MKEDLIKALTEMLRKNLTSDSGSAMLGEVARSSQEDGEDMITVSVYAKSDDESWVPFLKAEHEFQFAANEYALACETMGTYDADKFDVSISYGKISANGMSAIQLAPFFEFMSSLTPLEDILDGTKSEYIGEA